MREVVSKDILRILTERARFFDIILDDVSITQLTFSKVYEAAVEAKQVAQQEAERAKFVVDKATQEKQSYIVKAEGEVSLAARLIWDMVAGWVTWGYRGRSGQMGDLLVFVSPGSIRQADRRGHPSEPGILDAEEG